MWVLLHSEKKHAKTRVVSKGRSKRTFVTEEKEQHKRGEKASKQTI
jgi:hypothetical protein